MDGWLALILMFLFLKTFFCTCFPNIRIPSLSFVYLRNQGLYQPFGVFLLPVNGAFTAVDAQLGGYGFIRDGDISLYQGTQIIGGARGRRVIKEKQKQVKCRNGTIDRLKKMAR